MDGLQTLDWIILALYFAVILGIAWWVIRKKQESSTDYFLAGRHVGWFVIGASVFASNIGSEHIVGLAGTAAKNGVAMAHYELHAWCVLLLGWVFVPFYMRTKVFTMPEFLERRYSPTSRWFLSIISLVAYVLTKVSVTVYAGAVVFQTLMGIDFWTGALFTVILTGLYTVAGGLRAVVYTEALQAFILILGSVTVLFMGLKAIGGWENLVAVAGADHFNLFPPLSDPDFPWLGLVLGAPIVGIWYWCTDQCIVQRVLAARNEQQARRGTIFAAFLKLLPFWIFFIPGITAYALAKSGQLNLEAADQAFPTLVKMLLPTGLRGLVVGGLLAALMSSLSSVFNSCSTLFTMDIYKRFQPAASDRTLVTVGRVATAVLVGFGLLWIPFMDLLSGELFKYIQSVQAYISPPIAAVFLIGILWKRVNSAGAIAALIIGFVLGIGRLLMEMNKASMSGVLLDIVNINFLHFAIILFAICVLTLVAVSLMTKAPDDAQLKDLTFATIDRTKAAAASDSGWRRKDMMLSTVVLIVVGVVWATFTG